jgi:AcrR family transcriptional regulator
MPGSDGPKTTARVSGNASSAGHLPPALRPRKIPRQDRAKETVVAILQAAAELFADQGYAAATTNRIAHRAGVSVGSLYQYFPNKASILVGLMARHRADVDQAVAKSLPALENREIPFEHGFRSLLRRLVDLHAANPTLVRALSGAENHLPRHVSGGGKREDADIDRVARILRERPDVRAGDATLMALLVARSVEATTRWLVHDAPPWVDRREAIDEIVHMVSGYVTG